VTKTGKDIPNVLASRYATKAMCQIWSETGRIRLERDLWIAVMKSQRDLGLVVSDEDIAAYELVKDNIDIESIRAREAITRHDVKARIEEFCDLAGREEIHKGMTSRDLTENVEQLQILKSLELIRMKAVAVLNAMAIRAEEHKDLLIACRTHNVAAQPGTFGKRIAMFGEELLRSCQRLDNLVATYPVRGLKGAVGTQLDQLTLFGGDSTKVRRLEDAIVKHLGFDAVLRNVGQVYPRSLDFEVTSTLYQLACAPADFARTLRLMAGHELAGEGFAPGQVGSSAMPHKMNTRSCERINGFHVIIRGYLAMSEGIAGGQWNEGDVSCSVVRRVLLPDLFFAMDGLLETTLTVLRQMEVFPEVIARENRHYLPFLSTTTILMEAVKGGAGRETAHEAIKEHALAVVRELRNGTVSRELNAIIDRAKELTGMAAEQVDTFMDEVHSWLERFPDARDYQPGDIL